MSLEDFEREVASTRLGPVTFWTKLTPAANRPLLVTVPGILANFDDLIRLAESLAFFSDACLLPIPLSDETPLSSYAAPELSAMVGELLDARFPGRQVILLGVSSGATIALGVRARTLARIVAVEPPLVADGFWPIAGPLQASLRAASNRANDAFAAETLGVGREGVTSRDHLNVLQGLATPTDVVLGATPLHPQRPLDVFPSLVDEPVRRRLATTPGVRLHVVPGTGHNVVGQAINAVREVLLEASRRTGAGLPLSRRALDEPLLEATPLTARRLVHWGPHGELFVEAFQALNPGCDVTALGQDLEASPPGDAFDTLVLAAPAPAALLARLTAGLQPSGHLVARCEPDRAALQQSLTPLGLTLREPVDNSGTGVIRAQKLAPGQTPRGALALQTVAYSSLLMDIRTRLPTRGLGSEPDLRVTYGIPPMPLASLPFDAPKIFLMQRPAELRPEVWKPLQVRAIREGWLTVMEYDDYPPLVAEVLGLPRADLNLKRFGYVHAVQTASPPLVELFRPHNPEIALFPNAAFDLAPFPQGPRRPRVFYGAVIRGRYAVEVARALGPAIASRPETEFVVIGDRDVFDAIPTETKTYYEYMSYEGYLELMSQCTVSLSPIEALPFRETKSDAKFVDAARAGVLTIASPTIYDRVIQHGVNGFLAPDIPDWAPLLTQALTDEALRERLARHAWEYVRDTRMFAYQVATRRDWYWDLWARREALNAALIARTPGLREALAS